MSTTSIFEGVRNFFAGCPLLDPSSRIGVDFLGAVPTEYVIEPTPGETTIRRYVDGGEQKQALFTFASREAYGLDVLQNLDNLAIYEAVSDWLAEKTKANDLPELPAGKTPIAIEALTGGYLFDAEAETGRYQIQCRLTYYQEG